MMKQRIEPPAAEAARAGDYGTKGFLQYHWILWIVLLVVFLAVLIQQRRLYQEKKRRERNRRERNR